MEITDIIQTEATNDCRIHLYHYKGGVWRCYGNSALFLNRIYPNITYFYKDISAAGDIVPVMIIDHMTLEHLIENIEPTEQTETKIVIEIPKSCTIKVKNRNE